MNKKNNILILSLLLILFISISAISAADTKIDNTSNNEKLKATTVKDTTAHTKNTANVKDKLKTGNTKNINYLNNSGTFDLDFDLAYKSGDGPITISSSLTINGRGHTIDAKNKIRIFKVCTGATLTLKNLKIKNARVKGDVGGAILNSGTIKLTGCTFTNCQVKGKGSEINGGAIAGGGSGKIKKCTFDHCHADDIGGAIHCKNIEIRECNFNGCSAGCGGAIGGSPKLIIDSNFKNCKATKSSSKHSKEDGGGACTGEFSRIESCTFTKCKAEKGLGGAIRGTTHTINCNFTDCVAKEGGAIRGKGDTTGCTFENCKATKTKGGAIYTQKSTIKNSKFIKCSAKIKGGAIYAGIKATIKNCELYTGKKRKKINGNYNYI